MKKQSSIRCVRPGWALLLSLAWMHAGAQPSAPATAPAPSERAQRDADKVFQMILMHRDKKSPVKAPSKEATAAAKSIMAPLTSRDVPAVAATVPSAPRGPDASAAASPLSEMAAQVEPVSTLAVASAPPTAPAVQALPAVTPDPAPTPVMPATPEPKPALPLPTAPASAMREAALPTPAIAMPPTPTLPASPPRLELVLAVEPEFPGRLVRTLVTGSVVVNFVVAADGRVTQAEAVKSSHKGLEPAAIAAVLQWQFKAMTGPANGTTELKID